MAQPAALLAALVAIGLLVHSQWQELNRYPWHLDGSWFTLTLALITLAWALEIGLWRHLLARLDGRLPYAAAARIWFLSTVVRYIPGNIWQPLSMAVLCDRHGIRAAATLVSVALFQLLLLLGVLPVAIVYLLWTGNMGLLQPQLAGVTPWLAGVALAGLAALVARPNWLLVLLNRLLQRAGRPPLTLQLSRPNLLALVAAGSLCWLTWGAAYAALAFTLQPYTAAARINLLPHLLASYPMAYMIGYLSFITPSGLGAREGALYFWLTPILGGAGATVTALAMRLLLVAGELALAALSLALIPAAQQPAIPLLTPQPSTLRSAGEEVEQVSGPHAGVSR